VTSAGPSRKGGVSALRGDVASYGVRLLRGFELHHGDDVVTLPMTAQRLVAFLALHDRPMQRVHVAGVLWLDSTEEQAYASLRTALWRLRRSGPATVEATSSHLALAGAVPVDAREIALRAQRVLRGGPTDEDDLDRLADAGELLPDWYDDWVVIERERLRHLCVRALERMSTDAAADARFAEAVDAGLAAISFEPLRESAHRVVIEAHLAEGNAAEAIRQYDLFRRLLETKLGLEPSPRMHELMRAVTAP
jgi:DNA-binding SARP family transcriptional activator